MDAVPYPTVGFMEVLEIPRFFNVSAMGERDHRNSEQGVNCGNKTAQQPGPELLGGSAKLQGPGENYRVAALAVAALCADESFGVIDITV